MMKVSCKDLGDMSCHYVAEGETSEEIKTKLIEHGMAEHKEMMDKMTDDDKSSMMMKIDEVLAAQR